MNTANINSLPAELKWLASLGCKLLPVSGKKPLIDEWQNGKASNDLAQLEKWAVQFPNCNWGIATGHASGFFVLDEDGPVGRKSLAEFAAQGFELPSTLTLSSGNGFHHYLAAPSGIEIPCSTSTIAPGLDIKGNGGQVVTVTSTHPNGKKYEFVDPNVPIAPAPQWLLERILTPKRTDSLPMPMQARQPATDYERAYAAKGLRIECEKFAALPAGTGVRNRALNNAALAIATMVSAGWLDSQIAQTALWEAAASYRAQDGDTEAWNTLRSGWEAGLLKPRAPIFEVPLAFDPNTFTVMPKVENVALPIQVEATRRMEIITVSDIEPENIDWLWEHFLPRKKLALLAGKSNAGKSMLACELTSVASRGGVWPDGSKCEHPGHILMWTSEDGIRDTVVPRLIAAGADLKRVHIITAVNDSKLGKLPFNPATDIPLLKQTVIKNNDISLVVIDPIVSSVEGDMNQSNVVRKALESLVAFAEEVDCSVLGITHFKKNSEGQDPLERIIGSQAFHALPRVILGRVNTI